MDSSVSEFFAENSVSGGHGRNIVNVILVDFRAFDTLGEVVVVVIAGIAAVSLLKTRAKKQNRIQSLIFATTAHIVAALMLVFSVYLLLRGHNEPGGGFIGALIAVIGLSLLMYHLVYWFGNVRSDMFKFILQSAHGEAALFAAAFLGQPIIICAIAVTATKLI